MAIYARLENGTYAEVTGVYKADGTEVTEIFQGDRLVYSASNEIYGALPLYYNGKGYDLTDYLISGNTVQDGTPTPDAPVDVVGSGVRTGNLAPPLADWIGGYVDANGNIHNPSGVVQEKASDYLSIEPDTDYVFAFETGTFPTGGSGYWSAVGLYDENKAFIRRDADSHSGTPRAFHTDSDVAYIRLSYRSYGSTLNTMLNLGSTALPYEPYGYKLPLTVNGVEYPIYLGQVETTRRIKKLVLTGEENWVYSPITSLSLNRFVCVGIVLPTADYTIGYSTHYIYAYENANNRIFQSVNQLKLYVCDDRYSTAENFKAWLAAQYANGTPVTVWYVLAEPETAVVNEPLMKIGNYADTISFAQAGVTIPTVSGANVLDMASTVKPSEMYIKGKGVKPTGYGQLTDVNSVNILDKDGRPIYVHGQ